MTILVDQWRLAYMAVPKAGCSSVKRMLAQIDPNVERDADGSLSQKSLHRVYPTRRFRTDRWERVPNGFRFTVVRDPIKRLMSVFTNRVRDRGDLHKSQRIRRGRIELPADPDPDFFFQNLERYIAAASVIKHHALPTWLFTGKDLSVYDKVYRTSEIGDLAETLSSMTGSKVDAAHSNSSGDPLYFDDLRPETQDAIRPRLMADYRHLVDFFDNPFK